MLYRLLFLANSCLLSTVVLAIHFRRNFEEKKLAPLNFPSLDFSLSAETPFVMDPSCVINAGMKWCCKRQLG